MAYDSLAVIASVKRRASVPTAQATVSQQDFLDLINEEMQGMIVPLLLEAKSEYLVTEVDQLLLPGQLSYRMPARAVGSKLREVAFLDTLQRYRKVSQIAIDDLSDATRGVYVKGNNLWIWNANQPLEAQLVAIRMSYYGRPNAVILPSSAGTVQSVLGNAVTLTGTPPAGFVNGALFDLVRGRPGFECLATDVTGNVAGNVVTLATAPPSDIVAGDYVCLAQQSPVPQIPLELFPLLEQAVAVKVLQSICDFDALDRVIPIRDRMEREARDLIAQRIDGEPMQIVQRRGLLRSGF